MEVSDCLKLIEESIQNKKFVKLTLSKPSDKSSDLKNIYARKIQLKSIDTLTFTYRYATNDKTKNFSVEDGLKNIATYMEKEFHIATLFTTKSDITFKKNKRGIHMVERQSSHTVPSQQTTSHDREKSRLVSLDRPFLHQLGITDDKGIMIPSMADKYRQINKYLEIIDNLMRDHTFESTIQIVDMGSGKGYLTFALYDFLTNNLKMDVMVLGVESREDLVDFCNEKSELCGFEKLFFQASTIKDFVFPSTDILIALHACDTATDDAIAYGIRSNASIIVTAPCCHKQIRQQLKGIKTNNSILQHGIFKERQYEMVTDTIRGLMMEKHKYNTRIFEFISNEHTRKNVMLVGTKSESIKDTTSVENRIDEVKKEYQIDYHYLEKALSDK
jgi:hypothetical protein